MTRKRYSDEDALKLQREIEVYLHGGMDVVSSCGKAGISDKTYCYWRRKFGGMGKSQLSKIKRHFVLRLTVWPNNMDVMVIGR
jgi:hypothetical protein